jgi:pimeloyl-ACP methyl ester carboxylesterase
MFPRRVRAVALDAASTPSPGRREARRRCPASSPTPIWCSRSSGRCARLIEAACAAARTRDTYLAAQYRRVRARRGVNRASLAVAHSLLTAVWHMLQTGETYTDPGGDYYTRRDPQRTTRRLIAQLQRLGHTVTLTEAAAA